MKTRSFVALSGAAATILLGVLPVTGQWVTRDHRWPPRGPWNWAVPRELPQLFREFNGIDFGHAHLAETLLRTQNSEEVERARLEVLDFIFSSPAVPPDEEQVAPTLTRMVWEAQSAFNWTHTLHRSVYDILASGRVTDKDATIRAVLADYLAKPEALTPHRLDHHGKLWSFPESKAFSRKFPKFNTQIWAYHWLQAAVYDVQLMGSAARQRELMPRIIEWYHGYLRQPPVEWQFMPMLSEGAPEFTARYPELAAIFDNLHMLHDNMDDVLSRPDLYPTLGAKREAILRIFSIYLQRNHEPQERYAEYHAAPAPAGGGHGMPIGAAGHQGMTGMGHGSMTGGMAMGPRPPSAREVLEGKATRDTGQAPAEHQPTGGQPHH
ncbi:MAG TPA: hypothetical protein VGW35_03640 [Methylomirabilota bacterium]|jgi:hypothetical protein|nr:hypothetical protein [Methylomirabilota bacterium]